MNKDEILADVTQFIYSKFPLAKKKGLQADDSLLDSGVVDSMGILEIVTYIESEHAIQLTDEEVLADTFQSIKTIADLIASKRIPSES